MKKGLRLQIAAIIFCFLSITFILLSIQQWNALQPFQDQLTFIYKGDSTAINSKDAYQYQKENMQKAYSEEGKFAFTIWTQKDVAPIISTDLKSTATTPIVAVCGRTDTLFPGTVVLDYDQKNKCLLGYHTAAALFGGTDIIGLPIEYDGRDYEVAGILKDTKDAFVYEVNPKEDFLMNRITLRNDESNRISIKNKFVSKFSPDAALDYEFLLFTAQLFLMVIPVLLGIRLLRMSCRFAREYQICVFERVFWWGVFILMLIVIMKLVTGFINWPTDFIPSKWSDFQFWSELWSSKKEALGLFVTEAIYPPVLLFVLPYCKLVLFSIMGIICYRYTTKFLKKRKGVFYGNTIIAAYWENLWQKRRSSKRLQSGDS